jgi:hypothetical protein
MEYWKFPQHLDSVMVECLNVARIERVKPAAGAV